MDKTGLKHIHKIKQKQNIAPVTDNKFMQFYIYFGTSPLRPSGLCG